MSIVTRGVSLARMHFDLVNHPIDVPGAMAPQLARAG